MSHKFDFIGSSEANIYLESNFSSLRQSISRAPLYRVFVATRLRAEKERERPGGVQLLKLTLWPTEAEYEDKTFSPRSEMLSAALQRGREQKTTRSVADEKSKKPFKDSPITVRLIWKFLVGEFLKSTRHL
jgi:hypothetical protein